MESKLEAVQNEIRSNKCASTITNTGSETNEPQNTPPSGSENNKYIGVRASNKQNSDSDDKNTLSRALN